MSTMAKRDYYEVLMVSRTASSKEIAESYRKLAIKYHPDKNPGDEEAIAKFKECAEAFEVLSDDERRARYDRYGHQANGGHQFNDVNDIFEAFGDIFGGGVFGDLFGNRRGGRRVQRGADVGCEIELDLMEASKGVIRTVSFERHEFCATCEGTGAKAGTKPQQCTYCGGRGQVVQSSGVFRMQTTCPGCRGAGQVVKDACSKCRGAGMVLERVKREVTIPAGVDHHMRIRLSGEGEPGPGGGPRGDCYVVINLKPHPLFERDEQHLICRLPITFSQAALGALVELPTLDGPEDFQVPAGTQPGEVFRLRGRGMPHPRQRGKGDLLVQVTVEVPKKLSKRGEQLLRELAEEEQADVTPHRESFFEKLRSYFVTSDSAEKEQED